MFFSAINYPTSMEDDFIFRTLFFYGLNASDELFFFDIKF